VLTSPKDLHPQVGIILTEIEFGPNMVDGVLDESYIEMYSIFITDDMGVRFPDLMPIKNVTIEERVNATAVTCCEGNRYVVRPTFSLPENVTNVRLEVVPVLKEANGGTVVPAGPVTVVILDWEDKAFARASEAWRHRVHPLILLILCLCSSLVAGVT